ncbi:hypothetical protein BT69DRAFT_1279848 [Atractiella rhizophila]|nr:hypothetical protein BT69DRAFT_1279848 [Atractiella rhizophila]
MKEIKDRLWDSYFDVERTTNWALQEESKRRDKLTKKDDDHEAMGDDQPISALQALSISRRKVTTATSGKQVSKVAETQGTMLDASPVGGKKLSKLQLKMLASKKKVNVDTLPAASPASGVHIAPEETAEAPFPPLPPAMFQVSSHVCACGSSFANTIKPGFNVSSIHRTIPSLVSSVHHTAFEGPSPDARILSARSGTKLSVASKH